MDALEGIDLSLITDMLNDEFHECEWNHEADSAGKCSHTVTHIVDFVCEPGNPLFICRNGAKIIYLWGRSVCKPCGRLIDDCWKVRAV